MPPPRPEIEGAKPIPHAAVPRRSQRRRMAPRDIRDVDEIPDRGAVRRFPVTAVDEELGSSTSEDLHEGGDEVRGVDLGVFAEEARRVAADGVEVA